jgi:hypothetical protein
VALAYVAIARAYVPIARAYVPIARAYVPIGLVARGKMTAGTGRRGGGTADNAGCLAAIMAQFACCLSPATPAVFKSAAFRSVGRAVEGLWSTGRAAREARVPVARMPEARRAGESATGESTSAARSAATSKKALPQPVWRLLPAQWPCQRCPLQRPAATVPFAWFAVPRARPEAEAESE